MSNDNGEIDVFQPSALDLGGQVESLGRAGAAD